jgi:hypothetical protein
LRGVAGCNCVFCVVVMKCSDSGGESCPATIFRATFAGLALRRAEPEPTTTKRAGVCVALVGASDRVPACGNVPSMRRACASKPSHLWEGSLVRLWWTLSRALPLLCFATVSGRCLHPPPRPTSIFDADWTPRERPSWRIRIRWRSTGRRSSRLVAFTLVLLCCCYSHAISFLDLQHLPGVSTSASSSRP